MMKMKMMMMVMLLVAASAAPLPPLPSNHSSHDDQDSGRLHLSDDRERNSTRFESLHDVNTTNDDVSGSSDMSSNFPSVFSFSPDTSISSFVQPRCVLPTCLTVNLGSSLQGGDEKAGGATSDPFGIGKK
ncbi:uncharacterized protein zgc:193726 isoform X2 [Lates calcarifer]|uniref:Uncharacterized protein zgc:193726 isoform X2 n=1 Tax=Lates calcarifer TaxID=8187 RepID=A0AAJ8DWJ6_LATCA|nr:uncharacterized protein zgc:193726 isoform X2 [Lates calcarifer]